MPRPRTYDDALRLRLIDEAAVVLAAEGPHALTTRRVAAAAGTTTNALYTLVGGKADLVRAMYVEGFRRLEAALAAVPERGDPLARLVGLGEAYFANAVAHPHLYRVMFSCPVPEFRPSDDDIAFALSTLQTQLDQVAACVEAGVLAGEPAAVGTQLWAALHGFTALAVEGMLDPGQAWAGAEAHLRAAARGHAAG